ncbi:hypothetical protein AB4Z51_41675 [Bradyrhizobium sp. 2TAF36]|uniref:hypothetical protein n=1 Tax=Bradyrhizobium sp. 2TAF36 TaxID=3233016 RepID=UPI003F91C6CA
MVEKKSKPIQPFSVLQINRTTPGYVETRSGFTPTNPNVGTVTHEFQFAVDPWQITSTSAAVLCELSTLRLSLSKVFNPNNTTDSFYVISWNPNYHYYSPYSDDPAVIIDLLDQNGARLDNGNLGGLGASCGVNTTQSKQRIVDSIYFDRVAMAVFSLGPATWHPCG